MKWSTVEEAAPLIGMSKQGMYDAVRKNQFPPEAVLRIAATWAMNPAEEKRAFAGFIATVMERRRRYPGMHIYHYGAYEETAIKRMAGQHSICVEEVDELLRGDVLVDMFRAVKQGLRASVESYSIKKLEPLYEYTRDVNLPDANFALQAFQTALAFRPDEEKLDDISKAIEGYNRDDCVSAMRLRDWLERREAERAVASRLVTSEPDSLMRAISPARLAANNGMQRTRN